jgi:hypothetical protein
MEADALSLQFYSTRFTSHAYDLFSNRLIIYEFDFLHARGNQDSNGYTSHAIFLKGS